MTLFKTKAEKKKERAVQIKRSLEVTPEELTRRVTEAKKKKAKGK